MFRVDRLHFFSFCFIIWSFKRTWFCAVDMVQWRLVMKCPSLFCWIMVQKYSCFQCQRWEGGCFLCKRIERSQLLSNNDFYLGHWFIWEEGYGKGSFGYATHQPFKIPRCHVKWRSSHQRVKFSTALDTFQIICPFWYSFLRRHATCNNVF